MTLSSRSMRNQIIALASAMALTSACASGSRREFKDEAKSTGAKALQELSLPKDSRTMFDLGNGALRFVVAPLEPMLTDEFKRRYAYGPIVVARTDLGTRRFDFRSDLTSHEWSHVEYDEAQGRAWGFLENTVAGPGDAIPVVASFDQGITWQRLPDVPKPHHAARVTNVRRNARNEIEVYISVAADLMPSAAPPPPSGDFVYVSRSKDLGRGGWTKPERVRDPASKPAKSKGRRRQ